MDFSPTTRTQQAVSAAVRAATASGHPQVSPAHLVIALLDQTDGITTPLLGPCPPTRPRSARRPSG